LPFLSAIFYNEQIVASDDYRFSQSGVYYAPPEGPCDSYLVYIRSLPQLPHPEVKSLSLLFPVCVGLICLLFWVLLIKLTQVYIHNPSEKAPPLMERVFLERVKD